MWHYGMIISKLCDEGHKKTLNANVKKREKMLNTRTFTHKYIHFIFRMELSMSLSWDIIKFLFHAHSVSTD